MGNPTVDKLSKFFRLYRCIKERIRRLRRRKSPLRRRSGKSSTAAPKRQGVISGLKSAFLALKVQTCNDKMNTVMIFSPQKQISSPAEKLEQRRSRSMKKQQCSGLWNIMGFAWLIAAISVSTLREFRFRSFDMSLEVSIEWRLLILYSGLLPFYNFLQIVPGLCQYLNYN